MARIFQPLSAIIAQIKIDKKRTNVKTLENVPI